MAYKISIRLYTVRSIQTSTLTNLIHKMRVINNIEIVCPNLIQLLYHRHRIQLSYSPIQNNQLSVKHEHCVDARTNVTNINSFFQLK